MEQVENNPELKLSANYWQWKNAIKEVVGQRYAYFIDEQKPTNRIIILDKPYISPIIRGKEVKKVEFGAKLHKLQVDGIGFIEHISFKAFNEGIRLKKTIWASQKLFNKKVKVVGADKIYANNANRNYVKQKGIKQILKEKENHLNTKISMNNKQK